MSNYSIITDGKFVGITLEPEFQNTGKEMVPKKVKKTDAEKVYDDFIKSNKANEWAPGDWHGGAQAIMEWYLKREKRRANKKNK